MAVTTAKLRRQKPPTTKLCLHCHQVRNLTDFYSNRDWIEQAGKDIWCKNCISKLRTKDDMRKYFWENNREWDEKIWDAAKKKAEQQASKNKVYMNSSEDRKMVLLEGLTCQQVPTVMQIKYKYVDNTQDINTNTYEEAKENGKIIELPATPMETPVDPNLKTFSKEFNGNFKPAELEYLENYYAGLEADFDLSDTSLRDNAKKLAKASLLVDQAQDAYMAKRGPLQDVKDAVAQYDLLMKTGNFAACKRKPGDKVGLNSWAETTMYCETNGHPCIKEMIWTPDVIDRTIEQFDHLLLALKAEEG